MQKEIQQKIVSYLNGKGGILIIGTQKFDQKIIPIIEQVAEFHKEQHENRLQSYLNSISPSITLNKQVELNFVPIAENSR
jgi:predicted HTH transcriptional regulator